MSELSSDFENLNISQEYFYFIKDLYSDYEKYIKQFKKITIDYMKKLSQFQEMYSPQLLDSERVKKRYKNINIKNIFSIASIVPKIIKYFISNIELCIKGIDNSLKILESSIKEKANIFLKYESKYEESKNNLLKNYKNIDKFKDLYMNSMSNCEDLLYKYHSNINKNINPKQSIPEENNKKEKKDKKIKFLFDLTVSTSEQINNSISNSKKLEKQYLNSFESIETYEKNFNESSLEPIENMKKISYELTINLKDIIIDMIVLIKNSFKMALSDIEIIIPDINIYHDNSKYEKVINESYNLNKILPGVKLKKYKLKCFSQPESINGKYNPNNHIAVIEDGLEELSFIDEKATFLTIKDIFENFELIDKENRDLKLEEEKMRTRDLSKRLLSFDKNPISDHNILLTEDEIEELNNLLDKHHNRILFLQSLSTFRTKGIYNFPYDIYDLIYKFFCTIINLIDRDKDFHSVKNIIILSQTYYYIDKGNKKYLQERIKKDKLFNSYKFWQKYLEFSIEKEIIRSIKSDTKNGTLIKENQKESDDLYSNIVFTQLVPISDNMIDFGLDRKKIKEIIKPIIKHYNMNEQSITIIDDIIHKNSERKSILLNEEIKLIDPHILYKNYKNFDSVIKFVDRNEESYNEKNEVGSFNLNDIYEEIPNENSKEDKNEILFNINENRQSQFLLNKIEAKEKQNEEN